MNEQPRMPDQALNGPVPRRDGGVADGQQSTGMTSMHSESEIIGGALVTNDRSMGAILIDAGRLAAADAERVLKLQREAGLRFGDAAKQLGLIGDDDIQFALSRQFDYAYLSRGASRVSEEVVAAYSPFGPQVEAMRALRSQLMLRWFSDEAERHALAIVSPGRGEGRSWLTANLAVVFSQLGERTLVIDADMRNARQHRLFGVDNALGLSAVLSGRGTPECVQRVPELRDLSILPAGVQPPNPQELLSRPLFASLLKQMAESFDVVLIDSPGGTQFADGQTISVRAGGALMVARRDMSPVGLLRSYADLIRQGGASVVGSVLNEF